RRVPREHPRPASRDSLGKRPRQTLPRVQRKAVAVIDGLCARAESEKQGREAEEEKRSAACRAAAARGGASQTREANRVRARDPRHSAAMRKIALKEREPGFPIGSRRSRVCRSSPPDRRPPKPTRTCRNGAAGPFALRPRSTGP